MNKYLSVLFSLLWVSAYAQELSDRVRIRMVYEGGYSPLAKAEVQIVQEGEKVVYSVKKEYYEEASTQREGVFELQKFETLLKTLESYHVWDLEDLTEFPATDGFTYTFEIEKNGKIHRFRVYFPELQKDARYRSIIDEINKVIGER